MEPPHPGGLHPLWLVVSRPGKGREPWRLVASEPVETEADAWRIILAHARRWQIEMGYRYSKAELAMESPRLRHWCHRTGRRYRGAWASLYRLRSALSRLWQTYKPPAPGFT